MHVQHPAQGFCTNYEAIFGYTCFYVNIGHDHALYPTRTAKDDIVSHAVGILDTKVMLYAAGNRGQNICLDGVFLNITKILRNNDVIKFFATKAGIFYSLAGGKGCQIAGKCICIGVPALLNSGDLLKFGNDVLRRVSYRFLVFIVKGIDVKITVLFNNGRCSYTSTGYDGIFKFHSIIILMN